MPGEPPKNSNHCVYKWIPAKTVTTLSVHRRFTRTAQTAVTIKATAHDAGADASLVNNDGETALDIAKWNYAIKDTDVYWRLNDLSYN